MSKVLAVVKVYKNGTSYQGAKVTNSRNSEVKKTNNNGEAYFELENGGTVEIYVDGKTVYSDYASKFASEFSNGLIVRL